MWKPSPGAYGRPLSVRGSVRWRTPISWSKVDLWWPLEYSPFGFEDSLMKCFWSIDWIETRFGRVERRCVLGRSLGWDWWSDIAYWKEWYYLSTVFSVQCLRRRRIACCLSRRSIAAMESQLSGNPLVSMICYYFRYGGSCCLGWYWNVWCLKNQIFGNGSPASQKTSLIRCCPNLNDAIWSWHWFHFYGYFYKKSVIKTIFFFGNLFEL